MIFQGHTQINTISNLEGPICAKIEQSISVRSTVYCSNIKRVIFYTLMKPYINEKGEKEIDVIPPSTALQIAGRAGRYASQFVEGEVTTFKGNDLGLLQKLLNTPVELVKVREKTAFKCFARRQLCFAGTWSKALLQLCRLCGAYTCISGCTAI